MTLLHRARALQSVYMVVSASEVDKLRHTSPIMPRSGLGSLRLPRKANLGLLVGV